MVSRTRRLKHSTRGVLAAAGLVGVLAAASAAHAASCSDSIGAHRASVLVRRCINISPATHPPCNAENSCSLIEDEIRRGCGMAAGDAPGWCRQYSDE